jgi:hypothetical protein
MTRRHDGRTDRRSRRFGGRTGSNRLTEILFDFLARLIGIS